MCRFLSYLLITCAVLFSSCSEDDNTPGTPDTLESYFPLSEGNYWEYSKSYFKSTGELTAETDVYWKADSCCYYISRIELTPDTVNLGRDYVYYGEDGWVYTSGAYRYLSLEYLDKPLDSAYLVTSRDGAIPYEHYMLGGKERISTVFGQRDCIRTLSIYYYPNQRIEQYRWFCKELGEYRFENYQIELLKSGEEGDSYLTRTELRDYTLF